MRAQCVAFDAAEERVAAGDVSGRISIWNAYPAAVASSAATSAPAPQQQAAAGGGAPHKQQQQHARKGGAGRGDPGLTKQTLHWHSGPVRGLSFGREGAYLLSGGDEAVLVRPARGSLAGLARKWGLAMAVRGPRLLRVLISMSAWLWALPESCSAWFCYCYSRILPPQFSACLQACCKFHTCSCAMGLVSPGCQEHPCVEKDTQ